MSKAASAISRNATPCCCLQDLASQQQAQAQRSEEVAATQNAPSACILEVRSNAQMHGRMPLITGLQVRPGLRITHRQYRRRKLGSDSALIGVAVGAPRRHRLARPPQQPRDQVRHHPADGAGEPNASDHVKGCCASKNPYDTVMILNMLEVGKLPGGVIMMGWVCNCRRSHALCSIRTHREAAEKGLGCDTDVSSAMNFRLSLTHRHSTHV